MAGATVSRLPSCGSIPIGSANGSVPIPMPMPIGKPKEGGKIRGPTPALEAPWLPSELDAEKADQLPIPMPIPEKPGMLIVELHGPAAAPKGFTVVSVDR